MPLETIKDFDFGVGGSVMLTQRVGDGPIDASKVEVNLIVWLLLEQEFRKSKRKLPIKQQGSAHNRTQHDGNHDDEDEDDGDDIDDQPDFSRPSSKLILPNAVLAIARQYAEQTLRDVGLDLFSENLTENIREDIIMHLCRSCDLFQGNEIRSVGQIFRALRSASKFASKFNVVSEVGRGQFGNVYHVRSEPDRYEFAIKKISCSWDAIDEDVKMTTNESKILKLLRGHKNIISIYDSWLEIERDTENYGAQRMDDDSGIGDTDFEGPLKFYIQLEYCYQSLATWKEENYSQGIVVPVSTTRSIALQLFDGIAFIHSKNILHLDINPKNVLWKTVERNELKIVDFGLAVNGSFFEGSPGTVPYLAPERTLTEKSDVYSASITIIEVGKTIYTTNELIQVVSTKSIDIGDLLLSELLTRSLDANTVTRPTALQFKDSLLQN